MDGGAIYWDGKAEVGAGLTCQFIVLFYGRKKSKNRYKNLDNDSGLRQMGVVDKEVIGIANGWDVEEKVECNEGSTEMLSVCLSMWVDSQGMRACVLNIQIFKLSWDIHVASLQMFFK